ncbi:MAG: hypothetical protein V3T84_10130 [Phycisphaerales bacterium]
MFASIPDEEEDPWECLDGPRVDKLLRFITDANTGYLLVSSAGESFLDIDLLCRIARDSTADITWLVTGGFWGKRQEQAAGVVRRIHKAFAEGQARLPYRKLFVRLSVDQHHVKQISKGGEPPLAYLQNIVHAFEQHRRTTPGFHLMLHSIQGDEDLVTALAGVLDADLLTLQESEPMQDADGALHPAGFHHQVKVTESAGVLRLPSGYLMEVTFAKLLLSDLSADLTDAEALRKRIAVFDRDAFVNAKGNPALMFNPDGTVGPNILVSFDGSIAAGWQSEMPDASLNLDVHSFQDAMQASLADPGFLAVIENGFQYRFDIIKEVDPNAVLRAKAVNLRDYTSRVLLEEDRTRLYYTVRALRDFVTAGRIDRDQLQQWPMVLQKLVQVDETQLRALYVDSRHDIVQQHMQRPDGDKLRTLVELLNGSKGAEMEVVVERFVRQHGDVAPETLERWYTLFRRIARGWYRIQSLQPIICEEAASIAMAFSPHVRQKWRGFVRVSQDVAKRPRSFAHLGQ